MSKGRNRKNLQTNLENKNLTEKVMKEYAMM